MLISPEEAKLFFTLYPSVIGFAATRSGGIEGIRMQFIHQRSLARQTLESVQIKIILLILILLSY